MSKKKEKKQIKKVDKTIAVQTESKKTVETETKKTTPVVAKPVAAKTVVPVKSPMEILQAGQTFFNNLNSLFQHERVLDFEKQLKLMLKAANKDGEDQIIKHKDRKDKDRYVGFADSPLENTKANYKQTDVAFDINEANYPSFLRVWGGFEKPDSAFNDGMTQFLIHRGVQFPQTKGNRFLYTEFVPSVISDFFRDWIVAEEDHLYLFVAAIKFASDNTTANFEYRRSKTPEKKGVSFTLK